MKTTASARLLQHTQRRFLCGRVAQRANPAPFVDYISAKTSINFLHNRHLIQSNIISLQEIRLINEQALLQSSRHNEAFVLQYADDLPQSSYQRARRDNSIRQF